MGGEFGLLDNDGDVGVHELEACLDDFEKCLIQQIDRACTLPLRVVVQDDMRGSRLQKWIAVSRLKSRYRRYESLDDAMLVHRSVVPHSRLLLLGTASRR